MVEIFIKEKYILLGQFLKFSGVISNGGEAKFFLVENSVLVNDIPENRRGKKLYNNDVIEVLGQKFIVKEKVCENWKNPIKKL